MIKHSKLRTLRRCLVNVLKIENNAKALANLMLAFPSFTRMTRRSSCFDCVSLASKLKFMLTGVALKVSLIGVLCLFLKTTNWNLRGLGFKKKRDDALKFSPHGRNAVLFQETKNKSF